MSFIDLQRLLADSESLNAFVDLHSSKESSESSHLVALVNEMKEGNSQVSRECEELRKSMRLLSSEVEEARVAIAAQRNSNQDLNSQLNSHRQKSSSISPLVTELVKRAELLEERSESIASEFVDSRGDGNPNALDEWLRNYQQQRVSMHLARALASFYSSRH
jgi:predicted nuclease with TOPRIM domain